MSEWKQHYLVTYLSPHWSGTMNILITPETGDPGIDLDEIIDRFAGRGDEVVYIKWANGPVLYTAEGA